MRRNVTVLVLALAVLAAACGSDDPDNNEPTTSTGIAETAPSTTSASSTTDTAEGSTTEAPSATGSVPATVPPPATIPTGDDGTAASGLTPNLDDPVYVDLILDCVYGENEGGSCEQLEAAGLDPDEAYGLGNSISQAPDEAIRTDCVDGVGIGCAELNTRVRRATRDGDTTELLCFFHGHLTSDEPDDIDAFYEGELLGADAPPAVGDALFTLVEDPTNAALIATVDGYVGPICA